MAKRSAETKARRQGKVKRERVAHVADLLASGQYHTRETPKRLAAAWGVKPHTVTTYACDAANLLRHAIGEPEDLKAKLLTQLETVQGVCFSRAFAQKKNADGSPSGELVERNAYQWLNTYLQAVDRIVGLTGLASPRRVEVSHDVGLDELAAARKAAEANAQEQCPTPAPSPSTTPDETSSPGPSDGTTASVVSLTSFRKAGGGKSSS